MAAMQATISARARQLPPPALPPLIPPPPLLPETTPSGERPRPRNLGRTIAVSVAIASVLALVAAITVVVLQHRRDTDRYDSAHSAYLAGRCDDAISEFDTLLQSGRWINTAGKLDKARAERAECADLVEADVLVATNPAAALVEYSAFLSSRPETPLHDVVVTRATALIAEQGAARVASTTTCARLTQLTDAGLITTATSTAIELECATLYRDAGREDDAHDAALNVLRATSDPQERTRATDLLVANSLMCAEFDEVRSLAALDARPAALSSALQTCITAATAEGDPTEAARLQLSLLTSLPDDVAAPAAATAILQSGQACSLLGTAQTEPVLLARATFVADFTFWCAQVADISGDYSAAVERYQWFVDNAPLDERITAARDGLARALINEAESAGAGELPAPVPAGGAGGGATDVVVYNDSPEELRIVLSGPESRIEIVPASTTSTEYSLVGPTSCRTDVPSLALELQPGEYRAMVEATSGGVSPFVGNWTLDAGDAYESCFFVVTTFG